MATHVRPAGRHVLEAIAKRVQPTDWPVAPATRRLADVGSGSGSGLEMALLHGWDPVGIELAAEQLDAARAVGVAQVRGDAQVLPIAARCFDAAVSNFALIFAPQPERVIAEVARVCVSGAPFAFSAWCPDGWPQACRAVFGEVLGEDAPPFPTKLGTAACASETLLAAGFTDLSVESGTLQWNFNSLDEAVDTLTGAAGGLRLLRRKAVERGQWEEASSKLRNELAARCVEVAGGVALDDPYLIASGAVPVT